jgi:PDDEXK-like domain of unknown function (DUF3799)
MSRSEPPEDLLDDDEDLHTHDVEFGTLTEPGIYDGIPEAQYHADPCPTASLSRTVLFRLVELSTRHGRAIHPRLEPLGEAETDSEIADYGTAAHASFLQNRSIIDRLDFPTWQSKAAKNARKESYAAGKIPLLTKSYNRAMRLIDVLEDFRARTGAFTKGKPEQTVIWQEGSIWCRARVDWLPDEEEAAPWDLKTTAGFATLEAWTRVAWSKGYYLQDGFYGRGLEIVREGVPPAPMKFCVVEQKPPYGIGVFEMSPISRDFADEDVRLGIDLWTQAITTDVWPSYDEATQFVDPPAWLVRQREARGGFSPRTSDLVRERDRPVVARMLETGNLGG